MMLELLLLLFSIIFLLLIVKYSTASKLQLPPGPPKLPIIGNLHQLVGSKLLLHEQLRNLAKKHGPLMHLRLGEVSTVVVSDPDTAKEVLKTNDRIFSNRPTFVASDLLSFGKSGFIMAPHGEYWQRMRKITVLELLNPRRVRSFRYRSIREGEVNNIVNYISSSQGSVINLSNKLFEFANVVLCKTAFGEHLKSEQIEELIHLLETVGQLVGGLNLADLYPSWKFLRHSTSVFLKHRIGVADDKISRVLDNILNNHRRNNENVGDNVEEDLVDVFLRIQESDEGDKFRITTDNIKGVLFDMLAGGTDTTSTTLNWAMTEIMKNPNVMKKVQSEVREAMKVKNKQQLEESDIEGLQYLKLVIKETLRLHPPFPLIHRKSFNKCTVNGYDVPDRSNVLINVWALGRDPRYWVDPEKFEPERFLESSVDFHGLHFEFLPFGVGRRICPGIAFSSANEEMMLATLLYHFDWKLPDGESAEELDMTETFGLTGKRKKDLYVIATKVY